MVQDPLRARNGVERKDARFTEPHVYTRHAGRKGKKHNIRRKELTRAELTISERFPSSSINVFVKEDNWKSFIFCGL
jgi:hypothetical protein